MVKRNDIGDLLEQSVTVVRACKGARQKALAKLGIYTLRDLVCWYPHRYIDLSAVVKAATAPLGEQVTVVGRVEGIRQKQPRPRMHVLEAALVDETGAVSAVWFRQPWMYKKLHEGDVCAFTGKVSINYGMRQMNSPLVEAIGQEEGPRLAMLPVHHATEKISATWMRRLVSNALELVSDAPDPLPAKLRADRSLMGRKAAWRNIHFPAAPLLREQARRRLAYEEILLLQLEMMMRRDAEVAGTTPVSHTPGPVVEALHEALPYTLTSHQQTAVNDILGDMAQPRSMNRMLLGDVGCGKTAVAAFALAAAADTGTQAAMMAPTEVLARQYGAKLGPLLDACGVTWAVLTGSTLAAERQSILDGLASGDITCAFGTHALIEPDVHFKHMSLAIIDEQHRFGVNQRAALRAKGEGSDLLVMTATPIPRTLALTLYGDLETSFIRMRPAGRPPVTTAVISRSRRDIGYEAIRQALQQGRQAYIICPLVGLSREQRAAAAEDGTMAASLRGEGDLSNLKAAEEEAAFLQAKVFPQYKIGLLTGRMTPSVKQQVMDDFHEGSIDVLVSTTVVEVGVDVPNATVMIIEDAERFGLSQLHQLRGRVGRGAFPGQVYLVADPGENDEELHRRLETMVSCDDGFQLAEADLRARREGDVMGSRQHGASHLRLTNVLEDAELVAMAHEDARAILLDDPNMSNGDNVALAAEVSAVFAQVDSEVSKGA